ncbi:MAG: outer membrane protein assembly factor BamC [Vibrio sp.]
MKFTHQLVISSLAVLVLSACAGDPEERRQAKDDFAYLDTKLDQQWVTLPDAQPQFYPQFNIPQGEFTGKTGRDVDIRPPQQVLELIPGARVDKVNNDVTVWLISQDELNKVWDLMHRMADEKNIKLRADSDSVLETDWVNLSAEDESYQIEGRYVVQRLDTAGRYGFMVSLVEWREDGDNVDLTPEVKDRYSSTMVNYITTEYDKQTTEEARQRALDLINRVPVSLGQDRSGLPVLIARAPYDLVWTKVEDALPKVGFDVTDTNESQGSMEVTYKEPDDEVWESLGVKPLSIEESKYTIQLGDLDNRTSFSVADKDGKPILEEDLESFIPVMAALLDNANNQ